MYGQGSISSGMNWLEVDVDVDIAVDVASWRGTSPSTQYEPRI